MPGHGPARPARTPPSIRSYRHGRRPRDEQHHHRRQQSRDRTERDETWLDRSAWLEGKDASDIALILHWYAESADVQNRLYETPAGNEILISAGADVPLAAAHLLGVDVAATIGPSRLTDLLARWPGDVGLLIRELELRGRPAWHSETARRRDLLDALTRGLQAEAA